MKKFRIIYWFGSMTTECFVRADNKEDAEKKFKELKGERSIVKIEEV